MSIVKGVLIDLRARNFVHIKTSLRARGVHACHRAHNLSSPDQTSWNCCYVSHFDDFSLKQWKSCFLRFLCYDSCEWKCSASSKIYQIKTVQLVLFLGYRLSFSRFFSHWNKLMVIGSFLIFKEMVKFCLELDVYIFK